MLCLTAGKTGTFGFARRIADKHLDDLGYCDLLREYRRHLWHQVAELLATVSEDGREYDLSFRFIDKKTDNSTFLPVEMEAMGRDRELRIECEISLRHFGDAEVGEHVTRMPSQMDGRGMVDTGCGTFRVAGNVWERIY